MSGEAKTTTPDLTLRGAEASSSTATCCDCIKSPGALTVYAFILSFFVWVLSIASSQAIWFGVLLSLYFFTPNQVIALGVTSTTTKFFQDTDAKTVGPLMTAGMAFLIIAFIIAIVQFIADFLAFFNIRHSRHTRKLDYQVAWAAMAFALIGTIITGVGSSIGIAFLNDKGIPAAPCSDSSIQCILSGSTAKTSVKAAFLGDGLGCGIVAILFGVANGVLRTYMARMPEDTNFKPPFHQWCSCCPCCAPGAEKEAAGGAKATTLPAATAPPPAPSQQTA